MSKFKKIASAFILVLMLTVGGVGSAFASLEGEPEDPPVEEVVEPQPEPEPEVVEPEPDPQPDNNHHNRRGKRGRGGNHGGRGGRGGGHGGCR